MIESATKGNMGDVIIAAAINNWEFAKLDVVTYNMSRTTSAHDIDKISVLKKLKMLCVLVSKGSASSTRLLNSIVIAVLVFDSKYS